MEYKKGDVISTEKGMIKILKQLGEGGQGIVYKVDFNGEEKALKVYKKQESKDVEKSIINLSKRPCFSSEFIWPENAFIKDGVIHYIMKLRPERFIPMDDVTSGKVKGIHYRVRLNACINIAKAFRMVHDSGYAFLDINYGGFFVDPDTGDVLITDCDNIVPSGENPGNMFGVIGFAAPELMVARSGKCQHLPSVGPDKYTDYHSLAVLIHYILTFQHPLFGSAYLKSDVSVESSEDLELKTLGLDPVYIMDSTNTSNRAASDTHANFISIWNEFPKYMKETMIKAFSHEVLYVGNPKGNYQNRQKRLSEKQWLDVLFRLKSNTVICPNCGNDIFLQGAHPSCPSCHKEVGIEYAAKLSYGGYAIPIQGDMELYKGQLMDANVDEHVSDIYLRTVSKNGALSIKNTTENVLFKLIKGGEHADFKPGMIFKVAPGFEIKINDRDTVSVITVK